MSTKVDAIVKVAVGDHAIEDEDEEVDERGIGNGVIETTTLGVGIKWGFEVKK